MTATMFIHDVNHSIKSVAAGPISLPFEHDLPPCQRNNSGLNHAF